MIRFKRDRPDVRTHLKAYPFQKVFFRQITGRSGVALYKGITTFNGTINAGYRDRVYVLLFSFSDDDYTIVKSNRIAQIIIQRYYTNIKFVEYGESQQFPKSVRGDKGFGSSLGF